MTPLRNSPVFFRKCFATAIAVLVVASPASAMRPDYALFDELLLENVRNGFVEYDGFRADPRFDTFVAQIAATDRSLLDSHDEQLTFYINAYNALAIRGILDGYSPAGFWGRRKYFRGITFIVHGDEMTLEDIEHDRIIPLGDPRSHFAIVCASLSCPRLSNRAFTPERLDYQLHDAARDFINDPARNQFDVDRGHARLSMIFKWYRDEFVRAGGSLQGYLGRFADSAPVVDALREEALSVEFQDYDWNLNGHVSEK